MDFVEEAKREEEKTKKYQKVLGLLFDCTDEDVMQYFDTNSLKMLDLKIKTLEKINSGMSSEEIGSDYYKILEKYPKNKNR